MSAIIRHWYGEDKKRLNIVRACFFVDCGQGFDQLCVGWANAGNADARRDYTYYYGLTRLVAAIGIDNEDDIWDFVSWWAYHGAAAQNSYANYRQCGGYKFTFAEWVRDAFLDWLEPMLEDDADIGEEYNNNYPQEWLVMGEERAARVTMRWRERDEKEEDFFPMRLEYTAGDYPTFREFDNFENLNTEVIKWIGR